MKWLSLYLTFLMTFCAFTHAEAKEEKAKKVYVTEDNIRVTKKGIFVKLNDEIFLVKNLRSDRRGVFVLDRDLSFVEKGRYQCRYCPRMFWFEGARDKHQAHCEFR